MDFSKNNARQKAEDGIFVPLCDPYTREPYGTDEDAPGFVVRGLASRTVQASWTTGKADDANDDAAIFEAIHGQMIDNAMRYIIEARNVEWDGNPATTPETIRLVLDSTFPEFKVKRDSEGNEVTRMVKSADGEITVPQLEIGNWPFAKQVVDAAEDGQRFFGNRADG